MPCRSGRVCQWATGRTTRGPSSYSALADPTLHSPSESGAAQAEVPQVSCAVIHEHIPSMVPSLLLYSLLRRRRWLERALRRRCLHRFSMLHVRRRLMSCVNVVSRCGGKSRFEAVEAFSQQAILLLHLLSF